MRLKYLFLKIVIKLQMVASLFAIRKINEFLKHEPLIKEALPFSDKLRRDCDP